MDNTKNGSLEIVPIRNPMCLNVSIAIEILGFIIIILGSTLL